MRSTNISPPLVVHDHDSLWLAHEKVTGMPLTNALRIKPVYMSIAVALMEILTAQREVSIRYSCHGNN